MGIDEAVRALFAPKMVYSGRLLESNGLAPCHCTVDEDGWGGERVDHVNKKKRAVDITCGRGVAEKDMRGGVVDKQSTGDHSNCQIV